MCAGKIKSLVPNEETTSRFRELYSASCTLHAGVISSIFGQVVWEEDHLLWIFTMTWMLSNIQKVMANY